MSVIIAVPILSILLMIQTAVLSRMPLLQGWADPVLLAVIAWALQKRVRTAWQWGIIGGLLVGFVSAVPIVLPLITYAFSILLALALRQRVWQVPIMAMFIATFFGTLVSHISAFVALNLSGTSLPLLESLNLIILPSLLLNLLVAVPIYAVLADLAKWIYPEELEM